MGQVGSGIKLNRLSLYILRLELIVFHSTFSITCIVWSKILNLLCYVLGTCEVETHRALRFAYR